MVKNKPKKNPYSASVIEGMGHEMKMNPPKILAHTAEKFGAARAEKQRKAILLNKARRAGAKIKGSKTKKKKSK